MAKTRRVRSAGRKRFVFLIVVIALLAGAAWTVWGGDLRRTAAAGTAYGARVACSCRFVAGRSLEDCAKDKLEGMELVRFSENSETKSVTASIPLIASDTASYHEGSGCLLRKWQG